VHDGCFAGLHDGRVSLIEGHEGPTWWDLVRDVKRRWPEVERREYPLWLRAECCGGETLWAANEEHLEYIAEYVGAGLRKRRSGRLPGWMKDAKHRDEVLHHLDRMRATLGR